MIHPSDPKHLKNVKLGKFFLTDLLSFDTLPQKMKKVYEWSDELRQYMKENHITEPEKK